MEHKLINGYPVALSATGWLPWYQCVQQRDSLDLWHFLLYKAGSTETTTSMYQIQQIRTPALRITPTSLVCMWVTPLLFVDSFTDDPEKSLYSLWMHWIGFEHVQCHVWEMESMTLIKTTRVELWRLCKKRNLDRVLTRKYRHVGKVRSPCKLSGSGSKQSVTSVSQQGDWLVILFILSINIQHSHVTGRLDNTIRNY